MISETLLSPVADEPRAPSIRPDAGAHQSLARLETVRSEPNGQEVLLRRMEFKYLVDRTTRTALARDVGAIMRPDAYGGEDGSYLVRSLYFDTPYHRAFLEKMDGAAIRHKLRVRAYGEDPRQTSLVRLEVKSRYLQCIHKIVVDVAREDYPEVEAAFQQRTLPPSWLLETPGVSKEFFRIQRQYNQEPKILIQYRRQAFERRELGRIRVNFDDELLATTNLELLAPLAGARRLLRYGHAVFEIKVDGAMPTWLHMLIGKYNLQNQAFSKYCYGMRSGARFSALARST
ncbi:MAG: VTC domain-containing protein [Pirellulaceae bacterium]